MNNLSREKWMRVLLADPAGSLAGRYLGMAPAAADALFAWAERLDAGSRRAALLFLELAPALLEKEGEEVLSRWAGWAVQAGRHSGETACRVLEQGAAVARRLPQEAGEGWLAMGLALARSSERAAWAYFAQTPLLLEKSPGFDPQVWGSAALPLLESGWQVRQLAAEFLEASAPHAGALGADALGLLAETAARIARHHGPIASSWIREGPLLLLRTNAPLRPALLELLGAASQGAAPRFSEAARLAAEAAPKLQDDAQVVFGVAAALFALDAEGALALLREAPLLPGLGEPQDPWRAGTRSVLAAAAEFPSGHPEAAACLLRALPQLRRLASPAEIPKWIAQGVQSARGDKAKAVAYFSLSSRSSRAQLAAYSEGIPYARLAREMGLFAQGLCGRPLPLSVLPGASTEEAEKLSERPLPATDGETIFLPELFWGFGNLRDNHRAARLSIAHQTAHFEFGTFGFDAGRLSARKSAIADLGRFAPPARGEAGLTWFFSRFALEALARDFFASFEGFRIDLRLQALYRGLSVDLDWLWKVERARRPPLEEALRRAGPLGLLCELLVRRSLGESALPAELAEAAGAAGTAEGWTLSGLELARLWDDLGAFFESLARPDAAVEDSAQRTAELYHLVTLFLGAQRRGEAFVKAAEGPAPPSAELSPAAEGEIPKEIAGAYEPLEPVSHRGDTDPAAAQERMLDLAQGGEVIPGRTGISPEEMQAFLDEHPEFDFDDALRGEGGGAAGFPGEQVPRAPPPPPGALEAPREEFPLLRRTRRSLHHAPESLETLYLYDEWDHTIADFRTGWCTVREQEAPEADPSDMERRAAESAGIIRETIRQFERIRPELMRRERGQPDGEEVDLARALEAKADHRRGLPWPDRLYTRRVKAERNVATLLLLDMSASTGERVPAEAPVAGGPAPPPETYATRWDLPLSAPAAAERDGREVPSVLDVEKEALLVMTRALEYLGDSFAIYGFSGHGREHVEVSRIKDFGERSHPKILRRIAGIRPRQSTRMGAAIRHATWRLSREEARYKSLILISDGYPQDMDYGLDRRDETYALLDTRAALTESEQAGIHPFCVTIDRAGYDYLGKMVPHEAYLVIDEVLELPKLLPKIYRRITW